MGYANYIPIMTSAIAPSGTVTASSEAIPETRPAWEAFDGVATGYSGWVADGPPEWLGYEFDAAVEIFQYRFACPSEYSPKSWKLQGYNGSTWDDLHSVTDSPAIEGWSSLYDLTLTGGYTQYRLYISAFYDTFIPRVMIDELELLGFVPEFTAPAVEWGWDVLAPDYVQGDFAIVPAVEWDESAEAPSYTVGPISLTVPAATWGWQAMPVAVALDPDTSVPASIIYRCTLTGAPDATTDVVLPISSLQTRLRSGASSYVSAVVPNGASYAQAIADRPNGEMVIERGYRFADGAVQMVTIARVTLDQIGSDKGGRNWSVTLTGYATSTTAVPKSRTLTGISYRASSGSGRRFRADLDLNLKPGDTAICGEESMVVATITHTVSPSGEVMEISE